MTHFSEAGHNKTNLIWVALRDEDNRSVVQAVKVAKHGVVTPEHSQELRREATDNVSVFEDDPLD